MNRYTIGMLAVVCVLSAACSKKPEEPKPAPVVTAPDASMIDSVKEQALSQVAAAQEAAAKQVAAAKKQAEQQMAALQEQASQKVAAAQATALKQVADVKMAAESKVAEYKELIVSATRPLTEIKAEAENLNIDQLKQVALKYKDAITEKSATIEPLLQKLKELPMSKKFGGEGLQIKDELSSVKEGIEALKARYDVYAAKLKGMGVDLSSFIN